MSKKRMIFLTSLILTMIVILFGIVKLYQTYAIGNYMEDASSSTYDIFISNDTSIKVPKNSYSNVFYMVSNTSPGAVTYGVGYETDANVNVKVFSTSKDPASGIVEENGKKYVKLRVENNSSTTKDVKISTILGYSGDSDLIVPDGITLVTEVWFDFATYISDLYENATKTTVDNNTADNIITYNYANIYDIDDDEETSGGLMNDRLGSNAIDMDGGNIRYYGANPNNYIYFNCSDYSNQDETTCELWRIIGVFNGKVKIIRSSSIGSLAWDQDKNIDSSKTTYDNDWSTSSLQVLLNQKYYNGDTSGTVTYYSGLSDGTSTSLNLASIGIKNNTTRGLISTETYYLRGYNSNLVYSDAIYNYERATGSVYPGYSKTWNGKIALAYPSDYGYATDFNYCTQTLRFYDNSDCASNNWMLSVYKSVYYWFLTPNIDNSNFVWCILPSGYVSSIDTYTAYGVAPVLSLNPGISVETMTTGEIDNPYKLIV